MLCVTSLETLIELVQDTDADGIVSKDELLKAMTVLKGDRSDAEADAVKKLLAGKESVTLKQLEQYVSSHAVQLHCM